MAKDVLIVKHIGLHRVLKPPPKPGVHLAFNLRDRVIGQAWEEPLDPLVFAIKALGRIGTPESKRLAEHFGCQLELLGE